MKCLVIFYSRTGCTRKAAKSIAASLKADLAEVFEKKKRHGVLGFVFAGRDAMKKALVEIIEPRHEPDSYDCVVVGTPVWAGSMVPAIRTYIEKNSSRFKSVAFFACGSSEQGQSFFQEMSKVSGKEPVATVCFRDKEVKDDSFESKVPGFAAKLE